MTIGASGPPDLMTRSRISVVIPTYMRGEIALASVKALLALDAPPDEIVLVDQTQEHGKEVHEALLRQHEDGHIRWIRLEQPSIPHAMNIGLQQARGAAVLFLDDDIVPGEGLVREHAKAQGRSVGLVAGQVLQPGQSPEAISAGDAFRFNGTTAAEITEFMGGNFSIDRRMALALGGFDENFVGAAFRFEAEFASRYLRAHGPIRFEPSASIRHLAISSGGTRAHGHHLRTSQPSHSVGAYYYLLVARPRGWLRQMLWRPLRAVRTRHHLRHPWWIPLTLIAEARGLLLALRLKRNGPRLVGATKTEAPP